MIAVFSATALAAPAFVTALDPAPSFYRSKARSRRLDCDRLSLEEALRRYPDTLRPPGPNGDFVERTVLACAERLMRPGLRDPQDEAVLGNLSGTAASLAARVDGLSRELLGRTWLVETYYPSVPVSTKISFATKDALVQRGLQVSDRRPVLSAGDVDVLVRLPPLQAYPAACARYVATGVLRPDDVLLAVVVLDPRETELHAGLCAEGQWKWLR